MGYRISNGVLAYSKAWEEEDRVKDLPPGERMMILMVDFANMIHPNIVMTGDCTKNHASGRVPMLDLAIYMEEVETEINTSIGWFRINVEQVS